MNLGYRKFLFITNQTNILDKTEENLVNKLHQKYLFDEQILINSERVELKKVT
jgi:type III restriction enzyme